MFEPLNIFRARCIKINDRVLKFRKNNHKKMRIR